MKSNIARTQTDLTLKAKLKQLVVPIAVAAITAGATNAFGALSLTKIPTVLTDTSNEGRCITVDGKFVGGLSGTANGFLYDVAKGNVIRPLIGSYAQIVTGIAWRTSNGQAQLILDAENNGMQCRYMTWNAGTNWGAKFLENAYSLNDPPENNSLAGNLGSPDFYWIYRSTDKSTVYTKYALGAWDTTTIPGIDPSNGKQVNSPDKVYTRGISTGGRNVGYRLNGTTGINVNNLWDYKPASGTSYQWNGLDGTTAGEGWSVSQDGTIIFGRSPITPGTIALYAYKTVLHGTAPAVTQTSINALPELPGTISGSGITREVPLGCTGDGRYAVGYYYTGSTLAALWDTSSATPANWTAWDLSALATAHGAGVPDVFSSLTRAYSVGIDGTDLVITGYGMEAGTGNTRAFVMRVPKSALTPTVVVTVTGIRSAGTSVVIDFSSSNLADTTTSFTVQHATTLINHATSFANVSPAPTITGSAGSFHVTVAKSGSAHFYRISRP